jgi:hypothetical protein
VVSIFHNDRALIPGYRARDPKGQVVGLGASTHEHTHAEITRKGVGQAFCVTHNIVMQVAGMRVEGRGLAAQGVNHVGMAAPYRGDIVVAIQVSFTIGIVQPHAFATYQVHRFLVKQAIGRAHCLLTAIQ